jgi:holin-like protein
MLQALLTLLLFQLFGEIIVRSLSAPIPGPVVGMLLLFVALLIRREVPKELKTTAQGLVGHLSLLFVPAGVGVMVHTALLQDEWLAIVATLIISTFITMIVTAVTMRFLSRF